MLSNVLMFSIKLSFLSWSDENLLSIVFIMKMLPVKHQTNVDPTLDLSETIFYDN